MTQVKRYEFSCVASTTENFLRAQMFLLKPLINHIKWLEIRIGVPAERLCAAQIHGLEEVQKGRYIKEIWLPV